jgi:two-component sensor histidine kinase
MFRQDNDLCVETINENHRNEADRLCESELNHRISNSFTLLAGAVNIRAREMARQQRNMDSEEVALILTEISSRISAVGDLHRKLAIVPDAVDLDLNDYLHSLCRDLVDTLACPGRFKVLKCSAGPCSIRAKNVLPVCLIVTELVMNSIKYAHPTGVAGILSVGCHCQNDGSLIVEVADDGIGLPDGFDPGADGGIGSTTIALLAKGMNAQLVYDSGPIGMSVRLTLPPSAVA